MHQTKVIEIRLATLKRLFKSFLIGYVLSIITVYFLQFRTSQVILVNRPNSNFGTLNHAFDLSGEFTEESKFSDRPLHQQPQPNWNALCEYKSFFGKELRDWDGEKYEYYKSQDWKSERIKICFQKDFNYTYVFGLLYGAILSIISPFFPKIPIPKVRLVK